MECRPDVLFSHLQSDLAEMVPCYNLVPLEQHTDPTSYAAKDLEDNIFSKYRVDKSPLADANALEKFIAVNQRTKNWELCVSDSLDEILIGEFKTSLDKFWHKDGFPLVSSLYDLLDRARVGPGSSIGARGGDLYTKMFSSPLTSTSTLLYETYSSYIALDPDWSNAEQNRSASFGDHRVVEGSRLSFAFKKCDISRLICTVPSLNMFYQLGLAAILEDRIKEVWNISLDDQPDMNRLLAQIGSREGSFGTIDLSSASDSVGMPLLRATAPRTMCDVLDSIRCGKLMLNDSESLEMATVGTMGEGFTFPLQMIVFLCVITAVYRVFGVKLQRNSRAQGAQRAARAGFRLLDDALKDKTFKTLPGNFGCFGDDLIVVTEMYPHVVRLLNLLGFQVNSDKSFVEGPFRESCGADYFSGSNVRAVRLKALASMQDRYVAINSLAEWTARTGIPLPRTTKYLVDSVRKVFIPMHENDDAGIRCPRSIAKPPRARDDKGRPVSGCWYYQKYESRSKKLRILENWIRVPRGVKPRMWNPPGLHICFLAGNITDHTIGVRLDAVRYDATWGVSSLWDYTPTDSNPLLTNQLDLVSATRINLLGLGS